MTAPTTPEELAQGIVEVISKVFRVTSEVGKPVVVEYLSLLIAETFERWAEKRDNENSMGFEYYERAARRLAKWRDLTLKQRDFYFEAGRGETRRAEAAELRVRGLVEGLEMLVGAVLGSEDATQAMSIAQALLKEVRE
jgi:hypothetical protein